MIVVGSDEVFGEHTNALNIARRGKAASSLFGSDNRDDGTDIVHLKTSDLIGEASHDGEKSNSQNIKTMWDDQEG